jgi:UDP-N-acetylmuramyl pentapeptide synthase
MISLKERVLWFRALDYLHRYQPLTIGVAGSIGKTIVKGLTARVLQDAYSVYAPPQPYTTPLGIALGIMGQDKNSQSHWISLLSRSFIRELSENEPNAIIVELGAHKPGHMDWVAQKLPVNIAIITNVGTVRTDIFGNQAMVAHEIASLPASLSSESIAILNIDDQHVAAMASVTKARVVTFGQAAHADIRLTRLNRLDSHGFVCEVKINQKNYELHLPHITARHHIPFVLASLAVVYAQSLDIPSAINRVQKYRPPEGQHALIAGHNRSLIIDDSFEASPESMLSSLETLRALPAKRRIAILGGIPNLASESISIHTRVGKLAGEIAGTFVGIGEEMKHAQVAAMRAHVDTHHFNDARDVGKWFESYLQPGDVVLICGSKDHQLNQITKRLAKPANQL